MNRRQSKQTLLVITYLFVGVDTTKIVSRMDIDKARC